MNRNQGIGTDGGSVALEVVEEVAAQQTTALAVAVADMVGLVA